VVRANGAETDQEEVSDRPRDLERVAT